MTRQRKDEYVLEIEVQDAATYKLTTEKTGTALALEPISCDPSGVKRALVADERSTGRRKGKRAPIPALWDAVSMPVSAYAEGNRLVEPDADPAIETALGRLLKGVAQNETLTTTSKVAAAPSPTVLAFQEDANSHAITAPDGSTTAVGIVGVVTAAGLEARPYTHSGGPAAPLLDLLVELDAAPAAGALLLAGQVFQCAEQWELPITYPLTVRALGNDDEQNAKLIGAVPSLAVPEAEVDTVPRLDFSLMTAYGETGFADSRPAAADPINEVSVWAGGQVLLAPYGDSDKYSVCAKPSMKLGASWQRIKCPGGPAAPYGVQGFIRGAADDELQLVIPHDLYPDDIGATATRWLDILDDDATVAADREWHCLVQYGFIAGRVLAVYWPRLILQSVSGGELDGTDGRTLVFSPHPDAAEPKWVMALL